MEEKDRKMIEENLDELVDKLDCCSLLPFFRLTNILSRRRVYELQEYNDRKRVNIEVLINLCRRSKQAVNNFANLLWISGQKDAAKLIQPEEPLVPFPFIQSVSFVPRVDSDLHYKMTSSPRGFCVIINNRDFEVDEETRYRSELDAENLKKAFAYLGFDVHPFQNKTHKQMLEILDEYSKKSDDLKHHDAIVVVIMTHGGHNKSYKGVDGGCVYENEIISPFTATNCPELKDKPKMFFLQACRGGKSYQDDEGVLRDDLDNDEDGDDLSRLVHDKKNVCDAQPYSTSCRRTSSSIYGPSQSDMLISYATIPGYRAYRTVEAEHDSHLGSWYVKALFFRLTSHAHEKELKEILNDVYKDVSEMETEQGYKQTTTYENRGFHKQLFFNPGYYR